MSTSSCSICGQTRRADCYGGEMGDETECPGWARRYMLGGYGSVTEEMVKKAAAAFVLSADHEVRHVDIRAALEAALDEPAGQVP